ncbi:hypothetical protein DRJ22_05555 [Candidatus Woesearchaeota archaeon]|nr:MAG: hypothetical protein DRJ22_05555 [Candidatus Woesearchaeota archaeon]
MSKGLEKLAEMDYPGRFIILGKDTNKHAYHVVIYGLTGRSESSQARIIKYDNKNKVFYTKPTNKEALSKGIQSLLLYPAIMETENGIAVSNGFQTNLINTFMNNFQEKDRPTQILTSALTEDFFIYDSNIEGIINVTSYEPDKPNYTPRISGCITKRNGALHIVKKEEGDSNKYLFPIELKPGKGKLITTYSGKNKSPLPAFEGRPLDIEILGKTPTEIANAVWESLNPDYRVSVAVLMKPEKKGKSIYKIINKK